MKDTRPTTSCLNDGEHDFNGGDCSWPYCLCPRYDAIPTATAAADMSGSDTPRCDAYEIRDGIRYVSVPRSDLPNWSSFARQLERELAQSQARCAELEKALRELLPFHEGWHTGKHVAGQWLEAQEKAKAALDAALKEPR